MFMIQQFNVYHRIHHLFSPCILHSEHTTTSTGESKGAKRIKKALNKKQSFIIDPDMYDDPSALENVSPGK